MHRSKLYFTENKYDVVCKALGINVPQQQQTKALPPIVNPNALTEVEIVEVSEKLGLSISFHLYLALYDSFDIFRRGNLAHYLNMIML